MPRKEQINWQDLHLFNTRHTWPGIHVWLSQFSLLSHLCCTSWAAGTAPLNHSSITTNKSGWYLPSLSHKPVKTCFLLFHTLCSFQPTMALVLPPGILVLWHLKPCSHILGLNYTQWNSYIKRPWYMQKGKEQAAPYFSLLFFNYTHSLKACDTSLLQTNLQVENFQTYKSAFACTITAGSLQIWHTLSWAHPRQLGVVCVLYCTEVYGVQ